MKIIKNEMRDRAEAFILRWRGTSAERAEAQTFTNEFFQIFGLDRKNLAQFEKPIQKKDETGTGFADLFWSGKLIIESKSAHLDNPKNWEKTLAQAEEYINNLLDHQIPQYIMLMNFKRIRKYEVTITKSEKVKIKFLTEVPLEQLEKRLDEFNFFIDFANRLESDEEKVNQEAARRIANVYDAIERKGYSSTDISVLLARILFCLFAEDTGIFERKQFENYIRENTSGKTLGDHLLALFETLDEPVKSRGKISPSLSKFPYVNGGLFDSSLKKVPYTTNALRDALLDCCAYDWSDISPVIFGSLFQALMNNVERRNLGAHFTSETNILRVIKPLFLDELHFEFDNIKSSKKALESFRKKIGSLVFLDPACGCGNFLVVIYRELMLLDIEVIKMLHRGKLITDGSLLSRIQLNNFYGYEIEPTSNMIASVAMWLTQHQMHLRLESEFGQVVPTIPLEESAIIKNCNALLTEWEGRKVFVKDSVEKVPLEFSYIVGNPPFIGKQYQTQEQKKDMLQVFEGVKGYGVLDYVTCWYIKAAKYMKKHPTARTALVSTNSIAQGEQPGILWAELVQQHKMKIQFAHQTFKWKNEAEGVAGVHCVVIGFGGETIKDKLLYEYVDIAGDPKAIKVKNINSYLVAGKDFTLSKRRNSICDFAPKMAFGSMPNDGGYLLLDPGEKEHVIKINPQSKKFIKKFIGSEEFLYNKEKYCLWLLKATPNEIKSNSDIYKRVQKVKETRTKSTRPETNKLALIPHLFGEIRQPITDYIIFPEVTSEKREYIPVGMQSKDTITSNKNYTISSSDLYVFGILSSKMHITWTKYVCGRLESRFQYSTGIVYNNYPWPTNVIKKNKEYVESAAKKILDVRNEYLNDKNCLANLYDINLMPQDLLKAHRLLDSAVDKCYGNFKFATEGKRLELLFNLYDEYTANLFTQIDKSESKVKKKKVK